MKKIVIGILAHVDAGKTTLSESILYTAGTIRRLGRVDNQDAFLDTFELERKRGITIFSKQAVFPLSTMQITLLDTPGHVDFSAEMERTLQVLDYAILVISGADGVQGHTLTLWRLLEKYQIPVFLFINKMDQNGTDREKLLAELKQRLDDGCIDFSKNDCKEFHESIAMCSESALEAFLESGTVDINMIRQMIWERRVFPCFFGSALKLQGVNEFMQGMEQLIQPLSYPSSFGAKVFKIARDEQGNRLTFMKITGGTLRVRSLIEGRDEKSEKVNQIRIYSGTKYESVSEANAGTICAVTGLTATLPGEGLGMEAMSSSPILTPVLNYRLIFPDGEDPALMLPKLRLLEEEEPMLHILWQESLKQIQVQVMGEVQMEILKSLIEDRFGVKADFDEGAIVYKETIRNRVEGVGHFEPLRHYAEVHLILEAGEPGSGLKIAAKCSEDMLDKNWQRLILTHLEEKEHKGVLTGSAITDMKITLVAGRAHIKHTEGGDFRQATYRAVRQGLMQAESVLLEPVYEFRLEVPETMIGRAMTDIEKMHGSFEAPESNGDCMVLTGNAPVATMQNYQMEVHAYTKGHGKLFLSLKGYEPCHNAQEVIESIGYEPERDVENPAGSVFCAHGAGFNVEWDQVMEYMHLESVLAQERRQEEALQLESMENRARANRFSYEEQPLGTEEVDAILSRATHANQRAKNQSEKRVQEKRVRQYVAEHQVYKKGKKKEQEEFLLVDGYNIIYAWEELKELALVNIDGAREKLQDILCDYQGMRQCNLIVVFDAYRVKGHGTELLDYHNIHVVFTKEAETADQYIEKFAYQNAKNYSVTVATSDGLEQIIIRGAGCHLLSAGQLYEEIQRMKQELKEEYLNNSKDGKRYLLDHMSNEEKDNLFNKNLAKNVHE